MDRSIRKYALLHEVYAYAASYVAGGKEVMRERRVVMGAGKENAMREAWRGCARAWGCVGLPNDTESCRIEMSEFKKMEVEGGCAYVQGRKGLRAGYVAFKEKESGKVWMAFDVECGFATGRIMWRMEDSRMFDAEDAEETGKCARRAVGYFEKVDEKMARGA